MGGLSGVPLWLHALGSAPLAPRHLALPSQVIKTQEKARCVEVEVHAGEILYLPVFWWHGVAGCGRNLILNWWYEMRRDKRDPGTPVSRSSKRSALR